MQNIIIDKPYKYVPPVTAKIWPRILVHYFRRYVRRKYGLSEVEVHGLELIRKSIAAGHGIMITPNHCRDSDPLLMAELVALIPQPLYYMASWHLFMQSRLQTFLIRRAGAFSIHREGMDRAALNMAIQTLETAERPLVVFPEGVVSRTNDRLNTLLDGTAMIARTAAKKRAKQNPPGQVVIHPLAIRYKFEGDLFATLEPVLDEMERRLSWQSQKHLTLAGRIAKLGQGLLTLKEIEYMGQPQHGPIFDRMQRLINHLLVPLETEWLEGPREGHVVARVKQLRTAILPDMIKGDIGEQERTRRWKQLADIYLAQQLSFYPPDYIASNPTPERLLETVERFEEDLTDKVRAHKPIRVIMRLGQAIEVSPTRERESRGESDPLMQKIEEQLKSLLGITNGNEAAPKTAVGPAVPDILAST
ncbi:MAG TPA: 1-acyl-sn-glycerol-3-phosphate acyltransferase [Tepidisphaeraceae bacterium]|jgi:1-acyl-sn-glycerol-3-phosphate acyltransferase|nr:1-acyl-sn-glycerol-3-phosphate acyltransferase [Tepidisphaeraceae bacterium]